MIKRSTNKDSKTKEFIDDLPCKSTNNKRIQGIQGEISHIHTGGYVLRHRRQGKHPADHRTLGEARLQTKEW